MVKRRDRRYAVWLFSKEEGTIGKGRTVLGNGIKTQGVYFLFLLYKISPGNVIYVVAIN